MKKSIKKHKATKRYCECGCTRFRTIVGSMYRIQCRNCKKTNIESEFKEVPPQGLRLLKVQPVRRVSRFHANIYPKTWLDKLVDWLYETFGVKGRSGERANG